MIIQKPHLFNQKTDIPRKHQKLSGFCSDVENTQEMKRHSAQF